MPQTSGAPCGKGSPRQETASSRTVKLVVWLSRTTRSALRMAPPACLTPMPPEKSPAPHRMAEARARSGPAGSMEGVILGCSGLAGSGLAEACLDLVTAGEVAGVGEVGFT